jgi:Zn-dependent protease
MEYLHKEHGDADPQQGVEPSLLPQDHVEAIQEDVEPPAEVQIVEEEIAPQDAEVLAEVERLQNQRPGWWRAIAILAVSLLLFVGAAQTEHTWRSWNSLFILVAALAFHELGHYVAMRCFGYRNLRMFFIPFFGAAVSGRHYNIAGWKKAVVALAGPVPGILIGAPLAVAGLVLHEPRVVQVALLLLILNGFNLLPFLPLDGGWIVHSVLFVRHPALDVVFRLVAALCLLGLAVLFSDWILTALAVFMLVALPMAWRLARAAYRLKQRGGVALSSDADTIPAQAALSILAELRPALPPQTTPRILAQNVANVFETVNAQPPDVLASFCLLAVHAGSFLLALGMSAVIAIALVWQRHA